MEVEREMTLLGETSILHTKAIGQPIGERDKTSGTSRKCCELAIPPIAIKFLLMDVQERAKGWGQVDMLMEEIAVHML